MDAVQEMKDRIDDLKAELAQLEGADTHDHGGAPGRDDAHADKLRANLVEQEAELEKRIAEAQATDGYKGSKDLDAEAFGAS